MYTARLKVKQFVFVNLSHSRAMGALNIVSQNFKLRLCIDASFIRQQEILIRLHGVGFLSIMPNKYLAVKDRARLTVEDTFVQLVTGAMRLSMIDNGMSIGVLTGSDEIQAIYPTLSAFVVHGHMDIVS